MPCISFAGISWKSEQVKLVVGGKVALHKTKNCSIGFKSVGVFLAAPRDSFYLGALYLGISLSFSKFSLGLDLMTGGALGVSNDGHATLLFSLRLFWQPTKRIIYFGLLDMYFREQLFSLYTEHTLTITILEWLGVGLQYEQLDLVYYRPGIHVRFLFGKNVTLSLEYLLQFEGESDAFGHMVRSALFLFF